MDTPQQNPKSPLFASIFSEQDQKKLILYLTVGIVLMELALTVGALVYSITNADRLPNGMIRFNFPWMGYLVSVVLAPVLVMLVVHLISLGFNRPSGGGEAENALPPGRAATFFALVRGAPTVILFAAFVLMGAAIYYLDGVMVLLLKLGDSFETIAIWLVGALCVAWIVSYVARTYMAYKARQLDAEYAFRREVLERTGMVILETKHAPTTELRLIPKTEHAALSENKAIAASAGITETTKAIEHTNSQTPNDPTPPPPAADTEITIK